MVAGSGAHAHERQPVLDRDRRDERLRPVAAGHAETVGAAGDGVARELLEIQPVVEQDRLDAELRGEVDEPEALDLPAAGPRVAEQHRVAGRTARAHPHVEAVEVVRSSRRVPTRASPRAGRRRRATRSVMRSAPSSARAIADDDGDEADGDAGDPERPARHRAR